MKKLNLDMLPVWLILATLLHIAATLKEAFGG